MTLRKKRISSLFNRGLLAISGLVFFILIVIGVLLFSYSNENFSNAAFNSSTGRFEDSLIIPHQVAQYTYIYENSSPSSRVGFFELSLQNISGSFPTDVIKVHKITDSYPVNTSGDLLSGGVNVDVPTTTASFFSGNRLNVRLSPQNSCVPQSTGGCQNGTLSPGARGKITIQISYKNNPPTGQHSFEGAGGMNFISGGNQNPIRWRINANLQQSNFVLDKNSTPNAQIAGPDGTGNPIISTKYTVVVDNIKATNGGNLQSPSGKCFTTINGNLLVGIGISNGRCVINVNEQAGFSVAGGQVTIDDGGSPISLTKEVSYSSKDSVTDVSGFTSKVTGVTKSSSGSGFVTFFDTTGFTNGVDGIHSRFYFNTENSQVADKSHFGGSPYVIPVSLKPENATQICVVVAKPDNTIIENSGNCFDLEPKAAVDPEEGKAELTNEEIQGIDFLCDIAIADSLTDCTVIFPSNKKLPSGGLKIAVGNLDLGGECSKSFDIVTCVKVPVGNVIGSNLVYAGIGDVEPILTGETAIVVDADGQEIDEILADRESLTEAQIEELNNLAKEFGTGGGASTDNNSVDNNVNKNNTVNPEGDLSRTGGGILITFGVVGFLTVLAVYITSRKSYVLDRQNVIKTRKIK